MQIHYKKVIGYLVIIGSLMSCNKDFEKISTGVTYRPILDSIHTTDSMPFTVLSTDSISGTYGLYVIFGLDGYTLRLYEDSTFKENHWTDGPRRSRSNKGKWHIDNGQVILKSGFKTLKLNIHQHKWATFLIPEKYSRNFFYHFNDKVHVIDSLAETIEYQSKFDIAISLGIVTYYSFRKY